MANHIIISGEIYGARKDDLGPIGGGCGYKSRIDKVKYVVRNLTELENALAKAEFGETVLIPEEIEIDMTARVYIEKFILNIGKGVTLAGERGQNECKGAILTCDSLDTPAMIKVAENTRITGLRIQGPCPKRYLDHHSRSFQQIGCINLDRKRNPQGKEICNGNSNCDGHRYYFRFPISAGIHTVNNGLEVDNCEISAFSNAGICLEKGKGHHIHHNFIHHCQYHGLGYGITHNTAYSIIEYNLFNWNRHSIAGSGAVDSGYVARNNIDLGESLSHCFDMHGTNADGSRGLQDGSSIAGSLIEIYNNTFRGNNFAVAIRGVPSKKCEIHHNWFVNRENAVLAYSDIMCSNNAHGNNPAKVTSANRSAI